jgi:hypothetical protein
MGQKVFPRSGTYIGTFVDVPEPQRYDTEPDQEIDYDEAIRQNAAWYQWNQAQMAFHAIRHQAIASNKIGISANTRMREFARPESPHTVDVYADPPLALYKSAPKIARRIGHDAMEQFDTMGIGPDHQPTWIPLGRLAFRRINDAYRFRESYTQRLIERINYGRQQLTKANITSFVTNVRDSVRSKFQSL